MHAADSKPINKARYLLYWLTLIVILQGCAKTAEEKAFHEILLRIDVAIGQGLTLDTLKTLELDASTKYLLAKPKLTAAQDRAAQKAITDVYSAGQIWQASVTERCEEDCINALKQGMIELQITKTPKTFAEEVGPFDDQSWTFYRSNRMNTIIKLALAKSSLSIKIALEKMT